METRPLALEIGPGEKPAARGNAGDYAWHLLEHPSAFSYHPPHGIPLNIGTWGGNRLPFDSNRFDLVYASHVLEHIPWDRTAAALAEAFRILKPGGLFEVWVPNFEYLVDCYQQRICGDHWRHENPNDDPLLWLNGRLFTYGPEPNYHKATFDPIYLEQCLAAAGFTSIARIDPAEYERGHRHGPISLGMRAAK